jgi:hypothetical protein
MTPSIILLYPHPPIPGIVSTGLIFPFTYMSTYFHHITLLHAFFIFSSLPLKQTPRQDLFYLPVLFLKKDIIVCLT